MVENGGVCTPVPRQNSGVLSFTPLTMLQAPAQAVDFKVGRHFGERQESNSVSVIDTARDRVVKTIAVGARPWGVVIR